MITKTHRARAWILLVLAQLAPPASEGAAQRVEAPVLVGPEWLAARQGEPGLVVLQVGPAELFAREHLPGARGVDPHRFARPTREGGVRADALVLEMPEPSVLEEHLAELGVSDDSRIVIVPAGGWLPQAARVAFVLDWAGLGDRTHFLDGGLEAWKAAGHPVSSDASPVPRGDPNLQVRPGRVVSAAWVRERWLGEPGADAGFALVDARSREFYDGSRADRGKRGHIPGAGSLPWNELFEEGEGGGVSLVSIDRVRSLLAAAGVEPGDTVVAYCHIGQRASLVLLAARAAGYDVRLFDGSMNEWALLDLPVETSGTGGR